MFRFIKNIEGYSIDKFEKAFELTYQLYVDFLVFQPGLQYIIGPSNPESPDYKNVIAFYTRLVVNL
jgi:carbohydrate-selective porin OprB